ncbi:DNA repair protein RecN [Sediminitomix flava]|uniref:DNA repair protein RecN n=1 Tax=Sediminitomix flava TaxID=379075 RepID=A0A315Z8L6_SEDFL|nr:DNA repair protein RecN [Sediminitomix flava]PWJ41841.1 DNA replication and repair protein RecN [Sediminitomix flava]
MLKNLLIKNYALIRHLEINPASGLNIITGETGAGKSIMLGALGLLLGERAESKALFDQTTKCVIEGTFAIESYDLLALFEELELDFEENTILRREITPSGKSRAFVNDTPVRLEVIKQIGIKLMDIHSQHDTLQLGTNTYQLNLLDVYAGNQNLLAQTGEAYRAYQKVQKAYKDLLDEHQRVKDEFDYNQFLLKELTDAELDDLDQEELEKELEKLENAENIKVKLNESLDTLSRSEYAVESALKDVSLILNQLTSLSPQFEAIAQRTESAMIEIRDIAYEIESEESDLFFDQERIEQINDILGSLYSLQQKHKVKSVEELITVREDLQQKVDKVIGFDDDLAEMEQQKNECFEQLMIIARQLSEARKVHLPQMQDELNGHLHDLGMPNGRVVMEQSEQEPDVTGIDKIEILFSANKGREPQPMRSVASGGEFSRLMLAVKYVMAHKTAMPTIIFDEIDTGISGEIAIKVGQMMREMGKRHQVISISHLPQIAAIGEKHYFVYKDHSSDKTISKIRPLNEEERLQEIAQMIGGANPSEMAFNSAKELMES